MEDYFENQEIPQLSQEEDPFWDPPEPMLVGRAYYRLAHLANLFDNPYDTKIIDANRMEQSGTLHLNLVPTDFDGEADQSPLEEELDSPEDLLDKRLDFKV